MFKERLLKKALKRYAGEHVLEQVLKDGSKFLQPGADIENVTVYVQELGGLDHGYVPEAFSPEDLVGLLSDYLSEVTKCIHRHDGVIGNVHTNWITAFWGLDNDPEHPEKASVCALDCLETVSSLSERWLPGHANSIYLRVGINTGRVLIGNFGSAERLYFMALGDPLNIAVFLAEMNRVYQTKVILSGFTQTHLDPRFTWRLIDRQHVKGKIKPIELYELMGMSSELTASDRGMLASFQAGVEHYFNQEFVEAEACFHQTLAVRYNDGPASLLVERCRLFKEEPPGEEWDGTYVPRFS